MLPTVQPDNRIHIEAMMLLPEWRRLTAQQQYFLLKYMASGLVGSGTYDAVGACKLAYPDCKHPRILAQQLLTNKKIRAVLDLHFRHTQIESLIEDIRRLIKRSRRRDATWERVAKTLEAYVAKENTNG